MIYGAKLKKELWGKAILTATYLLNLSPTNALSQKKTPYEIWHGKRPNINHLKIFGCTAYVLIKSAKGKLDKKSSKGIFVGYNYNDYKVLDIDKIIVARDVIFDEIDFKNTRFSATVEENVQKYDIRTNDINSKINEESNGNEASNIEENVRNPISELINESKIKKTEQEPRSSTRIKNMPPVSYKEMIDGQNCYLMFNKPSCYTIEDHTFTQPIENSF